jgi:hypothetical protein
VFEASFITRAVERRHVSLHALSALDDALAATRKYRPRGSGQWLWVVLVTLFVGSPALSVPTGGVGGGGAGGEFSQGPGAGPPASDVGMELVAAAVAALAVVWLLVAILGALLEFPFLHWLRDGEASVGNAVGNHGRQALGLAAFRVVVGGLGFVILGAAVLLQVGTDGTLLEYVAALSNVAVLAGLVGFPLSVLNAFTTAFVVPTMLLEDGGVLAGWRRFWGTLADAPKQFAAYGVAVIVLGYAGGIAVVLLAVLALIPGLVVGGILGLVAAIAVAPFVGIIFAAAFGGLAFTIAALAAYALFQMYLRYYALLVLGDVDDDLDYIPGRRGKVRGDGPENPVADPTDPGASDGDDPQFPS